MCLKDDPAWYVRERAIIVILKRENGDWNQREIENQIIEGRITGFGVGFYMGWLGEGKSMIQNRCMQTFLVKGYIADISSYADCTLSITTSRLCYYM